MDSTQQRHEPNHKHIFLVSKVSVKFCSFATYLAVIQSNITQTQCEINPYNTQTLVVDVFAKYISSIYNIKLTIHKFLLLWMTTAFLPINSCLQFAQQRHEPNHSNVLTVSKVSSFILFCFCQRLFLYHSNLM